MLRSSLLALALAALLAAGCASPPRTDPGAVAADYAGEGRLDEASREIEIAVRTHPKDLALRRQAVEIYERAGHVDKAVGHLEDSIEIAPDDAETWILLAELENGRGNLDDAYVAYRRAEKLAPDDVRAVSGLALTADSLGFTRRGAARLRALGRAREDRPPARRAAAAAELGARGRATARAARPGSRRQIPRQVLVVGLERAAADLEQLGVAPEPLDHVLAHVAVAAQHLDRRVGGALAGLGGEQLGGVGVDALARGARGRSGARCRRPGSAPRATRR